MADVFINIPNSGSPQWKAPVANATFLPLTGNNNGDVRIALDTDTIYVWTGSAWTAVATPGAAIAIDGLIGDVSATGPGTVPAVVNFVGGSSAANVHLAELAANAATSSNTPNTIVKRDGSSNFSAGTITANLTGNVTGNLTGNVTGNVSGSSSSFTGALSGDVTGTQSATSISSPTVTGKLLTGLVAGTNTPIVATDSILIGFEKLQAQSSATSGSAITALTGDATATGPGSVPITLATVNGNIGTFASVTVNAKGLVTSASNLSGDATTSSSTLTLATVNGNVGSFGSSTSIPNFTVNAKGLITAAGSNVVIAPAGALTGTTLAANVVNSSLTSVGTLTSLTVSGTISASNFSGSSSGTNTGDVTLAAVGSSPNANAASLSGQVLNLQPASASFPGVITTGTQTISGAKTFSSDLAISSSSTTALTINTSSFIFDATNNTIGINNSTPAAASFIDGVNTSNATKRVLLTGYGSTSLVGFRTRLARNTLATPQAVQSGDILGFFNSEGYGTSQFPATATGAFTIYAGETFTNTSNATYMGFNTTPTGAVTSTERMRINSTGNILIGTTTDNGNNQLQVAGSFLSGTSALTDAANIATNAALANRFTVTLGGNRNLSAPTNPTDGQKVTWIFTQDATGGRTLTFDAIFDFGNMPTLILSSAANKRDYMGAIYNSAATKWDVVAYSTAF